MLNYSLKYRMKLVLLTLVDWVISHQLVLIRPELPFPNVHNLTSAVGVLRPFSLSQSANDRPIIRMYAYVPMHQTVCVCVRIDIQRH